MLRISCHVLNTGLNEKDRTVVWIQVVFGVSGVDPYDCAADGELPFAALPSVGREDRIPCHKPGKRHTFRISRIPSTAADGCILIS